MTRISPFSPGLMFRGLVVVISVMVLVLAVARAQAMAPAGVEISNQAEATYFNNELGITEIIQSNTVIVVVRPIVSFALEPGPTVLVPVGGQALYHFVVESRGNTPIELAPNLRQIAGDDFDIENFSLYVDANGNGIIDPGEPALGPTDQISLAPDERLGLIVTGNAPGTTSDGEQGLFDLELTEPGSGQLETSRATTNIAESGIGLIKDAALAPGPPTLIDYTIGVRNVFANDVAPYDEIDGEPIIVDGVRSSVVLVRDTVPVNTTFGAFGPTSGFVPYYHIIGTAEHTYVTGAPADLSTVDAVAFGHPGPFISGNSANLNFTVSVNDNAAGTRVDNTATGYFSSGGTTVSEAASNEVQTPIPATGVNNAQIAFMPADFSGAVTKLDANANTYVEADVGACNVTGAVDTVSIVLHVASNGDIEIVTGIETGGNTGVFRTSAIPVLNQVPAVPHNSVVSAGPNDVVTSSVTCSGVSVATSAIVSPGGYVFDSVTNAPVSGVVVQVRDTGGTVVAQATTDATGFFSINVPSGNYSIHLDGLTDFTFASVRSGFTGYGRNVDPAASYGFPFAVGSPQTLVFDIPVDPVKIGLLTLRKSSTRDTATFGEFVTYEVVVGNSLSTAVLHTEVEDRLPNGFTYVDGSARLNGASLADPAGRPGQTLTFALGQLLSGNEYKLTYVVKVLPSTGFGDRTNAAVARARVAGTGALVTSNRSSWTIDVNERGGVFSREATVLGKVYLECDGNQFQSGSDELGIPGVKIYLQNGLSVVTDKDGRYSIPTLASRTHVFTVYRKTLPAGLKVLRSRVRDAGNPASRFVDLKHGEVRVESFPVGPCNQDTKFSLNQRVTQFEGVSTAAGALRDDLPLTFGAAARRSARRQGEQDTTTEIYDASDDGWDTSVITNAPSAPRRIDTTRLLDSEIRTLTNDLGFMDLRNGDVLARDRVSIRVKGRSGAKIALIVNGREIGQERIGQLTDFSGGKVQAAEYVAVQLSAGHNTLEVTETDPFGNIRKRRKIVVQVAGRAELIQMIAPDFAIADSRTPVPVILKVVDAAGLPSQARVEVTLRATSGQWDVTDLRPNESGTQILISNGEALVDYLPPDLVGTQTLSVRGAMGVVQRRIQLSPNTEDNILVGLVEGAFDFGKNGSSLAPLLDRNDLSSFEETERGVRGAVYLKGRIQGNALLTLRYDSDRDTQDRLFRDVEPDKYYPVYGDSSERGFDAQSDSKLYVKVEKGASYILYGDVAIEAEAEAFQLGVYRRELTGGHGHMEYGPVTINLFAARTTSEQRIEEIRATGISGPYSFDLAGLVDNTDVVELVTRDRDRPGVVIDVTPQTRFTDYTIDYFAGTVIFNRPIPASNGALDPTFIRLTAEIDRGGKPYWVYGAEARIQLGEHFAIGAREIRSDAEATSDNRRVVRSAYVEGVIGGKGKWTVEVAESIDHAGVSGRAARSGYTYTSDRTRIVADAAKTEASFDSPNAGVSGGRTAARVAAEHTLSDKTTVGGEALYIKRDGDDERYGAEVRVRQFIWNGLYLVAGSRYVREIEGSGLSDQMVSGIAGAEWAPESMPSLKLRLEYERDIHSSKHYRVLGGAHYHYSDALRFYVDNEVTSSSSGVFGLADTARDNLATKAGLSYAWSDNWTTFFEYRESNALEAGLASGVKATHDFSDGLVVRMSAEHVEPIRGDELRNMAAGVGAVYETADKNNIARGDVEWSQSDQIDTWYLNQAAGWKISPAWTLLLRNRLALVEEAAGRRLRDRLRIGLAHRAAMTNRWSGLAWYEFEYDDDPSAVRSFTQMWSLAGEYEFADGLRLRPKYAGRYRRYAGPAVGASSFLNLAQLGIERDFGDRIVLGARGSVFTADTTRNLTWGVGSEISYVFSDDLIGTIGYNYAGIHEDEIRDIYNSGFYFRLSAKFDGDTWNIFGDE